MNVKIGGGYHSMYCSLCEYFIRDEEERCVCKYGKKLKVSFDMDSLYYYCPKKDKENYEVKYMKRV